MNDAMLVCSEMKHVLFAFLQQVNNILLQNISFNRISKYMDAIFYSFLSFSKSIVNEIKNIIEYIWQSYWMKCYSEFSED